MSKNTVVWFARAGVITRAGPFKTLVEAWRAMRYTKKLQDKTGYTHPPDTVVWPEESPLVPQNKSTDKARHNTNVVFPNYKKLSD